MWDKTKQFWIKLPANRKRQIVIGAVCLVLFVILWNFLFGNTYESRDSTEPSSISLTGADSERFDIDFMEQRLSDMEEELEENRVERQRERKTLRSELENMEDSYQQRIEGLKSQIEEERQARKQATREANKQAEAEEDAGLDEAVELVTGNDQDQPPEQESDQADQEALWDDEDRYQSDSKGFANRQDAKPPSPEIRQGSVEDGSQKNGESQSASITVIKSEPQSAGKDSQSGDKKSESQYIPAGSIISGTLITGLDAPTSQQARGEPHPALLRISKDTILPNRYRADMRECFIIISGYGDMSSERAYMRSEALSCINEEGRAMEISLNSFAVGEDGKAGVRGRLVSREGQMIAQSVMAGGLSAMSDVFSSSPVPTIATGDASGTQPFQSALSSESVQSGALTGAGDAMERIADYYLDMADQIFPILEVDAGRRIDLVVNQGTEIRFRGD